MGFDYVVAAELPLEPEEEPLVSAAEENGGKDPMDAPEESKEAVAAVGGGGEGKAGEPEGTAAEATAAR